MKLFSWNIISLKSPAKPYICRPSWLKKSHLYMHSAKPSTFHETRKNSRLFVYRRKLQKINEWTRLKLNFTFAFYLHFDSITIFKTKPFLYKITLLTNKFPCHDISEGAVCTFNMDVLKHPKTKFKWNHNVGTSGTYVQAGIIDFSRIIAHFIQFHSIFKQADILELNPISNLWLWNIISI